MGVTVTEHQKTQAEIEMERRNRALTDDDIAALADEFESRLVARFYSNLGRGIWGMVWRGIVGAAALVAAYGALKGMRP